MSLLRRRDPLVISRYESVSASANSPVAIPFATVQTWMANGGILRHLLSYSSVELRTPNLETLPKPLATAALLRVLTPGPCVITDASGCTHKVGIRMMVRATGHLVRDWRRRDAFVSDVRNRARQLEVSGHPSRPKHLDLAKRPLYVSGGVPLGRTSGGQVSHTAGVLNSLSEFAGTPVWVTTEDYDVVDDRVDRILVPPDDAYTDFNQLWRYAIAARVQRAATAAASWYRPAFVYERSSLGLMAGAEAAVATGVPFVLEFNSSDVTFSRLWSKPLQDEDLALTVERATIAAADLIVVVSEVLKDELVGKGADPRRVLVNPNGVDPDVYSPAVDGSVVRERYGLGHDFVIGFIGAFGPYHGTETLVEAFAELVSSRADRSRLRLLLVGDGPALAATRRRVIDRGIQDQVVFTGRTDQSDGPSYMAACDVLVSPHVPNQDGTPFFGSPIKLFEYMAMGKPIVASDMDQIAEILRDGETARLVRPGHPNDLAAGIAALIESPSLCQAIGMGARAQALRFHTWRSHTRHIIDRLAELVDTVGDPSLV